MNKKFILLIAVINLILIPLIYSQEINIDYPKEIKINEEFEISIKLINFSDDLYDLKFEILDNNKNIAKRFWENQWKSTHFYIKNAFAENEKEKKFKLKITENYQGENNFKVKIRDSKKTWIFDGFKINIYLNEENENGDTKNDKNNKDKFENNNVLNKNEIINKTENKLENKTNLIVEKSEADEENIIILGNKVEKAESIKTQNYVIYESKSEKIKKYSVFGFAILCVALSLLIVWSRM